MAKNNYYLIARNRFNNNYKIIKFSEADIIKNGSNYENRSNRLEDIDLFTSNFRSEAHLILSLFNQGKIDDFNVDISIVSRNGNNISFLETIYCDNDDSIIALRNIALATRQGNIAAEEKIISKTIDDFCRKIYFDDDFYCFVIYKFTNIYQKFIDYFKSRVGGVKNFCSAKYKDGKWALNSYPLIRNIVEASKRFEKLKASGKDVLDEALNSYNADNPGRVKIKDGLLIETDKNYFEGQFSLFDNVSLNSELSSSDKLIEVLDTINSFPRNVFVQEENRFRFNDKFFSYYLDDSYRVKLSQLLNQKIMKAIALYTLHNFHLKRAKETFNSTMELENDLRIDRDNIIKIFRSNSKYLDDAYFFCKLYNKCIDDNKEYLKKIGDNSGKVYTKKEDS